MSKYILPTRPFTEPYFHPKQRFSRFIKKALGTVEKFQIRVNFVVVRGWIRHALKKLAK